MRACGPLQRVSKSSSASDDKEREKTLTSNFFLASSICSPHLLSAPSSNDVCTPGFTDQRDAGLSMARFTARMFLSNTCRQRHRRHPVDVERTSRSRRWPPWPAQHRGPGTTGRGPSTACASGRSSRSSCTLLRCPVALSQRKRRLGRSRGSARLSIAGLGKVRTHPSPSRPGRYSH